MAKSHQQYDYLIVGQGLAGSLLAWQLQQANQRVMVIDDNHYGSASRVAAGIINPVTGHRINMTHGFEHLMPAALSTYRQLSEPLKTPLLQPLDQYRLIKNPGQLAYWQRRRQQSDYSDLLGERLTQHALFTTSPFGVATVKQSYRLDVASTLEQIRNELIARHAYRSQRLDYSAIDISDRVIRISDLSAHTIIFCEGYQAINNPWWQHLPFRLAKGEILTVELPTASISDLLNWGHWLLPLSNNQFKLGANYAWQTIDPTPTEPIREQLLESALTQLSIADIAVIDHTAGIRPTTRQRQPFIGPHPDNSRVYCFNGFGSKGSLLIPFYASLLTRHLIDNAPLPSEVTQCL